MFTGLEAMEDKPSIIINTGDTILDANFKKRSIIEERWEIWSRITSAVSMPIYSLLGNHDVVLPPVFRFLKALYNPFPDKILALQTLKMPGLYYSFNLNGWKFIGLNSIAKRYALDDKQFEWLDRELASTTLPVCIFSHVPLVSVASFIYHLQKKRWWAFPRKEMQSDSFKLQALFKQYKNVKLCLSGHVHYTDDVEYNGVRYLCGGAVCGEWWKGPSDQFPPEYTIIDLYEDGKVEKQLVYLTHDQ